MSQVPEAGAFSTSETIPSTAALGKGTVTVTSLTPGAMSSASITIT